MPACCFHCRCLTLGQAHLAGNALASRKNQHAKQQAKLLAPTSSFTLDGNAAKLPVLAPGTAFALEVSLPSPQLNRKMNR